MTSLSGQFFGRFIVDEISKVTSDLVSMQPIVDLTICFDPKKYTIFTCKVFSANAAFEVWIIAIE